MEVEPIEVAAETIDVKVVYNKQKFDVTFQLDLTVTAFKNHLEKLTGNVIVLTSCL